MQPGGGGKKGGAGGGGGGIRGKKHSQAPQAGGWAGLGWELTFQNVLHAKAQGEEGRDAMLF